MAVSEGATSAITSAVGVGILGGTATVMPMSSVDFFWFSVFAFWGITAKHVSKYGTERDAAKSSQKPREEWPPMDWPALFVDSLSAPFLGITGWSIAYYTTLWLWKVPLDKSVLLPAAMASGFIGAEWIRFAWSQVKGLISKRTGVSP